MDKQKAYDIVNGIGGIRATKKEADNALKILVRKKFLIKH